MRVMADGTVLIIFVFRCIRCLGCCGRDTNAGLWAAVCFYCLQLPLCHTKCWVVPVMDAALRIRRYSFFIEIGDAVRLS